MRNARALAILALLSGGCWPTHEPAPEEEAIGVFEQAEKQFAAGRTEDAALGYQFAIKHRSRWKEPYLKLARCHEIAGRRDEAIRVLRQLLVVDRSDEDGLRELARLVPPGNP
ncbi:MAG: tetratricopeptide repeat protein [Planctomycetes bacterium]|nr:tetratricopeptide repeat protein [Planctomycetota bacterium]